MLKILDNAMPMLSPSQVETCACALRWYFKYVANYPEVEKKASVDGSAIDKIVAEAIRTKVLPTSAGWGPVALVAIEYLNRSSAMAQVPCQGIEFAGGLFGGWDRNRPMAIDVLDELRLDEPEKRDRHGNPIPLLQDLKTTGAKKWVKSEETLRKDLQLLVYCRAVSLRFLANYGYLPEQIECHWFYVIRDTDKPSKYPVEFVMTQKDIDDGEAMWQARVAQTLDLGLAKAAGTLQRSECPKNTTRCGDYGGCAYGPRHLNVCDLSPSEIGGFMTSGTALSQEQIAQLLQQNNMAPQAQGGPPQQAQPQMQQAPQMQQQYQQPPQQMMQQQPQMQQYQQPQQGLPSPQQMLADQQAHAQQFLAQQPQQVQHAQALAHAQMHGAQGPQGQMVPTMQQAPNASQPAYSPEALQQALAQQGVAAPMTTQAPAPAGKKRGRKSNAEKAALAAAAAANGQPPPPPDDETDDIAYALDILGNFLLTAAAKIRGE